MSHLLFVETTGLGVQAIEYAKKAGHTVTYLHCPQYEFTAPPELRDRARELADHTAAFADPADDEGVLAALRDSGADAGTVDAALSTLSYCAQTAANLAEAIGARGTPADAVAAARDKGRCRAVLEEHAIPSLDFEVVTTLAQALVAADRIGYPVIVKPVLGIGKAVTSITRSPAELEAHFTLADAARADLEQGMASQLDERFIVEALAHGDLYSVEVAADGESCVPLVCVGRKVGLDNPVLELGCTVPSGLPADQERELGDYAVRVCRALGLDLGVFHVEVMHTEAGFRLIEVNPRLTGGGLARLHQRGGRPRHLRAPRRPAPRHRRTPAPPPARGRRLAHLPGGGRELHRARRSVPRLVRRLPARSAFRMGPRDGRSVPAADDSELRLLRNGSRRQQRPRHRGRRLRRNAPRRRRGAGHPPHDRKSQQDVYAAARR
ncbi:ATP-grasp domain-containing protein [Streptomyces pharetrae]|uniref:ATP-grasp domain-containing protein n=1 Tax=Streptomyces pharetrae TaxID=291370 RepID=UPI00335C2AC6